MKVTVFAFRFALMLLPMCLLDVVIRVLDRVDCCLLERLEADW